MIIAAYFLPSVTSTSKGKVQSAGAQGRGTQDADWEAMAFGGVPDWLGHCAATLSIQSGDYIAELRTWVSGGPRIRGARSS